jgi:hypothetical protein
VAAAERRRLSTCVEASDTCRDERQDTILEAGTAHAATEAPPGNYLRIKGSGTHGNDTLVFD